MQLTHETLLQSDRGRASGPSLFFAGAAALSLLAAALVQGNAYRWTGVALLLAAVYPRLGRYPWRTLLGGAVAAYAAWLLAVAVAGTPSYSADALYRPLVLILAFAFAATRTPEESAQLFRGGAALAVLLVLLGFAQFYFGFLRLSVNPLRAAATFITPNSFATAINLALLPLVALAATGRGGRIALAAALWLFAGLQSTESRGGWVAFAAGCAFILAMLGRNGVREHSAALARTFLGLAGAAGLFWASTFIDWRGLFPGGSAPFAEGFGETVLSRGSSLRLDIYAVAWSMIRDNPLAGYGADMFRFLYEMRKPAAMDIGHTFLFVHDDYLQIWVEFGLAGIGLLAAVIAAGARKVVALRGLGGDGMPALAAGAALTGFFVHALVDFPMYLPILLMGLGLWLGALARPAPSAMDEDGSPARAPLAKAALALAALAWLAQPAIADAASRRALDALRAGRVDAALYWQSVARRLEPGNAAHYWTEGVIWRDQAIDAKDAALAAKADMLFAEGMRHDPYQVANYLERARFRRMHPELFGGPSEAQILQWTGEALRLRPYSPVVIAEAARSLAHFGRRAEAIELVRGLLARHPDEDMARKLADEFGVSPGATS